MSWFSIRERMSINITDGSEFNNGDKIEGNPRIGHTNCDYCNKEVLCIFDDFKNDYYGYLGNQAFKPNCYTYSPIINTLKSYYGCKDKVWNEEHGNNLYNLHSRCHSKPNDWSKRAHPKALKILCNSCFRKTYKRAKVLGENGILYELSVLEDKGETVESVMEELDIKGKIV